MKWSFVLFSFLLLGCQLTPKDKDLIKTMVVQTHYNENTAFSFYSTFTLSPDTLGIVSNYRRDTILHNNYSKLVAEAIKNNMVNAGYLFLNKKQNPDLGIAAYVVENYSVFQQVSYPSYYSGYYGYGYLGYYGTPYVSTYSTSSSILVMNLVDLKNRDSQNRLKVIWTANIGDLIQSNDQLGSVLKAVDQAFKQSPYLDKP